MDCEQLRQLLPDLIDGILPEQVRLEAEAALPACPDCQREYVLASQVRAFLIQLQEENEQFRVSADFERRLIERVKRQSSQLELLDLSSRAFADWLLELIKLIGGLFGADDSWQGQTMRPQTAS